MADATSLCTFMAQEYYWNKLRTKKCDSKTSKNNTILWKNIIKGKQDPLAKNLLYVFENQEDSMNQARKTKLEFYNFEDEQTVIDTSPQAVISPMYQFFHSPYFPKTFFNVIATYFKGVATRMKESRENDRVQYADSLYHKVFRYIMNNLKS